MAVGEDLDLIERQFRQLQIEWEKFFGGVERKPPNELKTQVEGLIRRYAYAEIRNNTERFRYQSLASRYSTFSELWNKRLRALEEGRPVGIHGVRAAQAVAPPPAAAPVATAARATAGTGEFRVLRPDGDPTVRALYDRFLEMRKASGEQAAVKFDTFQKLIRDQSARIMAEKGAQAVDFRLEVKEGKVSLKAKPVK